MAHTSERQGWTFVPKRTFQNDLQKSAKNGACQKDSMYIIRAREGLEERDLLPRGRSENDLHETGKNQV